MQKFHFALVVAAVGLGACAHSGNAAVVLSPEPAPAKDATLVRAFGSFAGSDGVPLFEQSFRPAGEPRGVIILTHGLKDHSGHYVEAAEAWAQRGFAVFAFDLRGHGRSTGDAVWVDSFEDYVKDLDVFVQRVETLVPAKPVFVFGHSMGGAIVTQWVLEKKASVQGIVLSAPALKPGQDVSPGLIAVTGLLGGVCPGLGVLDLKNEAFSRDPAVVEGMAHDPFIHNDAGPARTASALLGAMENIQQRMAEVTVPFLVLHGTDDHVTNPEGSKDLLAQASSKDKTLKLYDGLAHDLLHEPEKAKVLEDITFWLEAHAPLLPSTTEAGH